MQENGGGCLLYIKGVLVLKKGREDKEGGYDLNR